MGYNQTYKIGLLAFNLIFSQTIFAESKIISESEIEKIEKRVETELKNPNLEMSKKFNLVLLVAREAYQYRFYAKAEKYYQTAIDLKVDENKTEAYLNLIAISIVQNDKNKLASNSKMAKEYFAQNTKYKSREVDYYLQTIERAQSNSVQPEKIEGFYGQYASEENLINLLKEKKYQSAYQLINPDSLKNAQNSFNITVYDSLNVLMNKKKVKNLYCNKEYKAYPNAYAYSTLVCGLLNDFLKNGKYSEAKLHRAEKYFSADDQDKKYLFDIVKEIK